MQILKFSDFIESGELLKALEMLKPDFKKAEYYNDLLKNSQLQDPELVVEAIQVLSGLYGDFETAFAIIESKKDSEEEKAFLSAREKKDTTTARKEASFSVRQISKVANLVEAYKNRCEKQLVSCQSLLAYARTVYSRGNNE